MDLCKSKASWVYCAEFQDSQGHTLYLLALLFLKLSFYVHWSFACLPVCLRVSGPLELDGVRQL